MTAACLAAWIWIAGTAPALLTPRPDTGLAVAPAPRPDVARPPPVAPARRAGGPAAVPGRAAVATGVVRSADPGRPAAAPRRPWTAHLGRQRQPLEILLASRPEAAPLLRIGPILADPALEEAARSGLPLRLRLRVELWRVGFFDSLAGSESWTSVLLFEPLEGRFLVRGPGNPEPLRFGDYDAARSALETAYTLDIAPPRPGRYYYAAELEIETLSLSDLDELRRWLRGELGPAVSGDRSVPAAVGEGVKRLLVRLLRLPARRYEARSPAFDVR